MTDQEDKESKKLVEDLRKWMQRNKKNQSQIADLLNTDRQRVSNWFNGKTVPSLEHGIRILRLIRETIK